MDHANSIPTGQRAANGLSPVPLATFRGLVFDRDAARAVDRTATEEYGIPSIVLMENAARALASNAMEMVDRRSNQPVLIACGSGNNGGDGYALARHLHNAEINVVIVALGTPESGTDAATNGEVCSRMNLRIVGVEPMVVWTSAHQPGLIVDAIFGTGLDRPVTRIAKAVIEWINSQGCPVLAADIPSGLDCDTGQSLGCCVRATRTVSFVGVKRGFLNPAAQELLGEVVVGDIGAPAELLKRFGTPIESEIANFR
jgi:NAD(P)H-hydrate epimerase